MKTLEDVRLLIFDLDGTIVNLSVDWAEVKRKVRKILKTDHSLTPLIPSIEKLVRNCGLKRKIYKLIDNEEMKLVEKIESDGDVMQLFRKLKELDYRLVLVTLQGQRPAIEALRRLKIDECFDLVISRDEKKDREEQIEIALRKTGVRPSQAVVVADKTKDMLVAKRLGCVSVAVKNKLGMTGDFRLTNIEEILDILEAS